MEGSRQGSSPAHHWPTIQPSPLQKAKTSWSPTGPPPTINRRPHSPSTLIPTAPTLSPPLSLRVATLSPLPLLTLLRLPKSMPSCLSLPPSARPHRIGEEGPRVTNGTAIIPHQRRCRARRRDGRRAPHGAVRPLTPRRGAPPDPAWRQQVGVVVAPDPAAAATGSTVVPDPVCLSLYLNLTRSLYSLLTLPLSDSAR
jgi:hypothetical protein